MTLNTSLQKEKLTASCPTAQFAQHHIWVTKYKDGELWAGGEFTNQSQDEIDGVVDVVARNEKVENGDVVV
jgi:primary-amine oxidase